MEKTVIVIDSDDEDQAKPKRTMNPNVPKSQQKLVSTPTEKMNNGFQDLYNGQLDTITGNPKTLDHLEKMGLDLR